MQSKIISIGTAVPTYESSQSHILEFMKKAYGDKPASRKLNALFRTSGIKKRYSVVHDFNNSEPAVFFKNHDSPPNVEKRMQKFNSEAIGLALASIGKAFENLDISPQDVTHLITVTCTGLSSPGLNAEIINKLDIPNDIYNSSVNFMGCGAAFHALKQADFIARSEKGAKVLVVCVELCTLHFQTKQTTDHLLSNTIFGDGAAAAIVSSDSYHKKGLCINGFYSVLLSKGEHLMGWHIRPTGFEMTLKTEVPKFIGEEINDAISKAYNHYHIKSSDVIKWAVHPGGKKILDEMSQALVLNGELQASYNILQDFGNMSSATILYVIKSINDEKVLAVGFGPGLTTETALFTYA